MKLLSLFALALAFQAQEVRYNENTVTGSSGIKRPWEVALQKTKDAQSADRPTPQSTPTIEQLQAQIAAKDAQIAHLQQKLTIYQQSAFQCQDQMLDMRIAAEAQRTRPATVPPKPRSAQPTE